MKSPPLVIASSSSSPSLASPCRSIIAMMMMILLSSSALVMSSSSFSTSPTTTRFGGVGVSFGNHHHRHRRAIITTGISTRKMSSHYSTTTSLPRLDRHLTAIMMVMSMRGGGGIEDDGAEKVNELDTANDNATPIQESHPSNSIATRKATAATPPVSAAAAVPSSVSNNQQYNIINNNNNNNKLGPNAPPPGYVRRLFPSFPWNELPNYLTYARCLSIPLFLGHAYYPSTCHNRAPNLGCIFAAASITDWFDGYLARRWDITSAFGAFLDPVADKLMVSTALLILSGRYGGLVAIPSAVILARELGVSALREWMASRGKRDNVKVGIQGKIKAALTMICLTCMLLVPEGVGLESVGWTRHFGLLGVGGLGNVVVSVGERGEAVVKNAGLAWMLGPSLLMLFASAIITVTSGTVYFRAALPVLLGKE